MLFRSVGSMLNAFIMVRMKEHMADALAFRCIFSTLVGEGMDATVFITIAFMGLLPTSDLLVMIVAQALLKTGYEVIMYPVTRKVIHTAEELD